MSVTHEIAIKKLLIVNGCCRKLSTHINDLKEGTAECTGTYKLFGARFNSLRKPPSATTGRTLLKGAVEKDFKIVGTSQGLGGAYRHATGVTHIFGIASNTRFCS